MNLNTQEIKAFLPAKNFELSKQFYIDLGFNKASDNNGIAYFHHNHCSFLLQDFYEEAFASHLMMHLLVDDAYAWHQHIVELKLTDSYPIKLSAPCEQPWKMVDFTLHDPSGVLWRIGHNC